MAVDNDNRRIGRTSFLGVTKTYISITFKSTITGPKSRGVIAPPLVTVGMSHWSYRMAGGFFVPFGLMIAVIKKTNVTA
jgi:hypothetical protein